MKNETYVVAENDVGKRLDLFVAEKSGESRASVQRLIREGHILVKGRSRKANYKVKFEEMVICTIPDPIPLALLPEDIPIEIIYEDEDLAVVNKPEGMVVHPAPGHSTGTLVHALLFHLEHLSSINGVIRPGIVHRIDKDTSGLLVIAKNDHAHHFFSDRLKRHEVKRIYWALAEGRIKDGGTIDKPVARDPRDRKRMAIVADGRHAITHYSVLKLFSQQTLLQCELETGRTHQIRVHLASVKHPLVGDLTYGHKKQRFQTNGQCLHAKEIEFEHPRTGEWMHFETELPESFQRILRILNQEGNQ
ncbi:RluA family pseudouridine synthase [Gottschalkiaceae bacterium SANA]|nr:RluA family pseudouridine synthase [Gottschalkiaceae bacterium SANA]